MDESQATSAQRMYNFRAPHYDDSWHPKFAKKLVGMAELKPGDQVLDLACGTGLATFEAARLVGPAGSVTGIDVTEGMLDIAKQKKEHYGQAAANVELHLHDIADLDGLDAVKEKTFDVITCASALCLLVDAQGAVRQWMKYLKPGGRLVVDVPHEHNIVQGVLLERVANQLNIQVPYARWWIKDKGSLKELLETVGLAVEREEFVEQTGHGKQYFTIDDAEDKFVSQLMNESGRVFRMPAERRQKAQELFKQECEKQSVDGKVEEVDGVYVAIARKPTS